jgi:hypothetical protein
MSERDRSTNYYNETGRSGVFQKMMGSKYDNFSNDSRYNELVHTGDVNEFRERLIMRLKEKEEMEGGGLGMGIGTRDMYGTPEGQSDEMGCTNPELGQIPRGAFSKSN